MGSEVFLPVLGVWLGSLQKLTQPPNRRVLADEEMGALTG